MEVEASAWQRGGAKGNLAALYTVVERRDSDSSYELVASLS